jgi:hypothetical protein
VIQKKHRDPYEVFSTVIFFQNFTFYVKRVISGFRLEVAEKCALLAYYAASSGVKFMTDVSGRPVGPIFRVQEFKSQNDSRTVKVGQIGCPETSVRNYHYLLRNNPEESRSLFMYNFIIKQHSALWTVYRNLFEAGAAY